MLTEDEAQQIATKFLLNKYYKAKLSFTHNQIDDVQVYQLYGKINMGSRVTSFDRFTAPKKASEHDFKIQIDAQQGQISSYEFK